MNNFMAMFVIVGAGLVFFCVLFAEELGGILEALASRIRSR